jgi:hypothetical protein
MEYNNKQGSLAIAFADEPSGPTDLASCAVTLEFEDYASGRVYATTVRDISKAHPLLAFDVTLAQKMLERPPTSIEVQAKTHVATVTFGVDIMGKIVPVPFTLEKKTDTANECDMRALRRQVRDLKDLVHAMGRLLTEPARITINHARGLIAAGKYELLADYFEVGGRMPPVTRPNDTSGQAYAICVDACTIDAAGNSKLVTDRGVINEEWFDILQLMLENTPGIGKENPTFGFSASLNPYIKRQRAGPGAKVQTPAIRQAYNQATARMVRMVKAAELA